MVSCSAVDQIAGARSLGPGLRPEARAPEGLALGVSRLDGKEGEIRRFEVAPIPWTG